MFKQQNPCSNHEIHVLFELLISQDRQGVHGQGKSQGIFFFFKVRELSGNSDIGQGILKFQQKSGKSQGILKKYVHEEKKTKE